MHKTLAFCRVVSAGGRSCIFLVLDWLGSLLGRRDGFILSLQPAPDLLEVQAVPDAPVFAHFGPCSLSTPAPARLAAVGRNEIGHVRVGPRSPLAAGQPSCWDALRRGRWRAIGKVARRGSGVDWSVGLSVRGGHAVDSRCVRKGSGSCIHGMCFTAGGRSTLAIPAAQRSVFLWEFLRTLAPLCDRGLSWRANRQGCLPSNIAWAPTDTTQTGGGWLGFRRRGHDSDAQENEAREGAMGQAGGRGHEGRTIEAQEGANESVGW